MYITRIPYHEVLSYPSVGNPTFKPYGNIYFTLSNSYLFMYISPDIFTKQTIKPSIVCFMQRHELADVPEALYCIFRLIKLFYVQFDLKLTWILVFSYN